MTSERVATSTRERRSLVLGAAVFLLGGIDAYLTGDYLMAAVSGAMALFNLVALALLSRAPDVVQLGLFSLNGASAAVMAYSTHRAGKQWLPYAWILAALVFLVVGWGKYGRRALTRGGDDRRPTGEDPPRGR